MEYVFSAMDLHRAAVRDDEETQGLHAGQRGHVIFWARCSPPAQHGGITILNIKQHSP